MNNHDQFIDALRDLKVILVTFNAKDKGKVTRKCIPFDFGPWRRNITPNPDRYHFYDLDSPDGQHNLSLLPEQIISFEVTNENFDPSDYVTWRPNWFVARNWGKFS